MISNFKRVIITVLQCTWGLLQTLAGAVTFLALIKRRHFIYRGCIATEWKRAESLSLGLFIFVTDRCEGDHKKELCAHEYGHCVQSLILGPLFLPVIGLPSSIWCMLPYFVRMREKKGISYHRLYTESWADAIAEKITGEKLKILK